MVMLYQIYDHMMGTTTDLSTFEGTMEAMGKTHAVMSLIILSPFLALLVGIIKIKQWVKAWH